MTQQFKGNGIQRWCAICACHRATGGGTVRWVMGGRHWVCARHKEIQK